MICRAILVALAACVCRAAPAAGTPEYEVKAAYVYNFAKFIEWPDTEPPESVTVCIYGKDPFGGFLDEAVRGKLVHGLPVMLRRLAEGEESWDACQMIFFGVGNSAAHVDAVLVRLRGRSIVTVGEADGFAERGGMIGLVVEHGRVRFDINLAAIAEGHLQVSSRLVELGRVVKGKK
ncbi:MAG: YfiR family protein [Acidobacteriia bacterium]|nr:YfiR family protein [Terriglobia bacterium]